MANKESETPWYFGIFNPSIIKAAEEAVERTKRNCCGNCTFWEGSNEADLRQMFCDEKEDYIGAGGWCAHYNRRENNV